MSLRKNQIDADSIYGFLGAFNEVYSECTDAEKKQFMQAFIERIDILWTKRNRMNIWFPWRSYQHLGWLFFCPNKKPDDYINVTIELDDVDITSAETKSTYDEIKRVQLWRH